MVGSTRIAGRLQVDAGLIRSEAGPLEPRLVVPVAIELSNRPADQMLALTHLTGHLNLGDEHNPGSEVGLPARLDFIPGFHARSLPEGQTKFTTEFRFQLSPIAVHRIEAARHASGGSLFELRIRCDAALAWIRKTGGVNQPSPTVRRARLQAILANVVDPHQRCQTRSPSGSLNRRASRA